MKKLIRYTFRIAGALLGLLLLLWLALAGYVLLKKDALLEKARIEIKKQVGGSLHIGQLDISFFRRFPSITLQLSDITLRDSCWQRHHHDLLQAAHIDISCSLLRSLRYRRIQLNTVFLEQGTIYFFTDSTGYSNTYLLKGRKQEAPGEKSAGDPPAISLSDIKWVMERQDKHKLFDLEIRRLDAVIDREGRNLQFGIRTEIKVNNFSFNTDKGSFVKDKILTGHFTLRYNTASKILQFDKANLQIGGHSFVFTGRFFPTVQPDPLFLTIETDHLLFRQATALLTPNLQQKLDQYAIDQPVSIQVQLDAGVADDPIPQIQIRMNLDHGSVVTPTTRFTAVSFQGSFTNEWVRGHKREDENSGLRLLAFSGQLEAIPLRADTIEITNLRHPQLTCDLHSRFPLPLLNDIYGSRTLQFRQGSCRLDLHYKGPLSENDSAGTTVIGRLDLDSAAITYLPYHFQLTNASGRLLFNNQDLVVDHLEARTGSTRIQVKGIARNLVTLIDQNTENVSMDWTVSSSHLDLEDFTSLAGRSTAVSTKTTGKSVLGATAARIDHFLKAGVIRLELEASDIVYKDFSGAHAKAGLVFQDDEIRLTHMNLRQGLGSIGLRATLNRRPEGDANPLSLESHIEQVDLPKLFRSFDNFASRRSQAKT